jgi:hypothetical protein
MSTQERRARNKREPRFHRKNGGGLNLYFKTEIKMSSSGHNKHGGKPGQRNRKAEQQRAKKPEQPQNPVPERKQHAPAPIETAVASTKAEPAASAVPAETLPIGLHTIATAYGDYTKKSLEETRSLVQKLSEVRSLDKALEVQTEFAKRTFDNFVAESQKMRELYGKLARQTFKPLEGFVTKSITTHR